jgi:hypothetical protein
MDPNELVVICNQIAWLERYAYELDCVSPQPTPELSGKFDVANTLAPQFIFMFRGLLIDAIYLGIARLLDEDVQGPHQNLSMKRMLAAHPNHQGAQQKLEEAVSLFADGRKVRNKLISHADYDSAMNYPASVISLSPDIETIHKVIYKLEEIVQGFPNHTLPSHPRMQTSTWLGVNTILDNLSTQ